MLTNFLIWNLYDLSFKFSDLFPAEQVIDIGCQAHMQCLTEERDRATILWRKDGMAKVMLGLFISSLHTTINDLLRTYGLMIKCYVIICTEKDQVCSFYSYVENNTSFEQHRTAFLQ